MGLVYIGIKGVCSRKFADVPTSSLCWPEYTGTCAAGCMRSPLASMSTEINKNIFILTFYAIENRLYPLPFPNRPSPLPTPGSMLQDCYSELCVFVRAYACWMWWLRNLMANKACCASFCFGDAPPVVLCSYYISCDPHHPHIDFWRKVQAVTAKMVLSRDLSLCAFVASIFLKNYWRTFCQFISFDKAFICLFSI